MITFTEVLNRIAADILQESGTKYDFKMCIANDLAYTEEDFTKKYGAGRSYHFPVDSYEQGKQLALTIYENFAGKVPQTPPAVTDYKGAENELYLYIHLSREHAA